MNINAALPEADAGCHLRSTVMRPADSPQQGAGHQPRVRFERSFFRSFLIVRLPLSEPLRNGGAVVVALIGLVRVSTDKQNTQRQHDALDPICLQVFEEKTSGKPPPTTGPRC